MSAEISDPRRNMKWIRQYLEPIVSYLPHVGETEHAHVEHLE